MLAHAPYVHALIVSCPVFRIPCTVGSSIGSRRRFFWRRNFSGRAEKHPFLEVSEARRDKPGGSLVTLVGDARIYCHARVSAFTCWCAEIDIPDIRSDPIGSMSPAR